MVSLIVPCYNSESFIDRCIDSILSQTYKEIELLLVNDGSTDATHQRIMARHSEIERSLTHFVYIVQKNEGVGAACSNAFSKATGEFLTLLDSDDLMLPESIEMRVNYLETHPDFALVRTNGYYVNEESVDTCVSLFENDVKMKQKEDIFEDLLMANIYNWPGTYMIRMNILKKYYPDQRIYPSRSGQNLQFLMMAAYHQRAGFIDVPLMKYVTRSESLSHFENNENAFNLELKALEGYKDIRVHLVTHYVSKDEQRDLLNRLEQCYLKIYMNLAFKYKNKELMDSSYKALFSYGKVDSNTRILYYSLTKPTISYLLRLKRKIVSKFFRK